MLNYNNIPLSPLSTPVPSNLTPPIYRFEDRLRDLLLTQGAHEHITSSLTQTTNQLDQVILVNALTSDQNALRTSLEPGLSHVLSTYKKHKIAPTSVFEIGKVFRKTDSVYLEGRLLTVMAGADSLATLMFSLGITDYRLNQKHEILIGDALIGSISPTCYTLVTDALMPHAKNYSGIVSEFAHTTSLDLSLLCKTHIVYADIADVIASLRGQWSQVSCKSLTKMKAGINNYLLTITWDNPGSTVETDKGRILAALKSKLDITSKS